MTFRTLLETANGLYREIGGAQGWARSDLMATLSEGILARPVSLERVQSCVYAVRLQGDHEPSYELLSRRRTARL
ncbi:MAG: hypothetical protein M3Z66_07495 [Chloroflexota bacterium]|nr:hypothetical protein [Chloroflexota bacterium]